MEPQETSSNPKELKEFEMTRTWRSKPVTRDALWLRRASKNNEKPQSEIFYKDSKNNEPSNIL